jgi:hypothetical protein
LAGIAIMPDGRRRAGLAETAEIMFGEEFRHSNYRWSTVQ